MIYFSWGRPCADLKIWYVNNLYRKIDLNHRKTKFPPILLKSEIKKLFFFITLSGMSTSAGAPVLKNKSPVLKKKSAVLCFFLNVNENHDWNKQKKLMLRFSKIVNFFASLSPRAAGRRRPALRSRSLPEGCPPQANFFTHY